MKILAVGGAFDESVGKPSGYIRQLFGEIARQADVTIYNGGKWSELCQLVQVAGYDVILWFPSVANDYIKIVTDLKTVNPKAILVTSKRNNNEYSFAELVARALAIKSNLCVEFKTAQGNVVATVFDPLGNVYGAQEQASIPEVARVLLARVQQLSAFTRVPSIQVGQAVACPDEAEFFDIVRKHASKFHELIHTPEQNRMLGNLSFRCEHGFPSFRHIDCAFVSRRNVDKRDIGPAGMVAVEIGCESIFVNDKRMPTGTVPYWGDHKPSVDTPVQRMLYERYRNVRYMLHSHVYIENAPFVSDHVIPCGAIDEFTQSKLSKFPPTLCDFSVNLRGHGSLVMANSLEFLRKVRYVARPMPEFQIIA